MSTNRAQTVIKAAVLVIFVFFAAANVSNCQSLKEIMSAKEYKTAVKNLRADIASENLGVRKCAIYFAGKYHITEIINDLVAHLQNETDTDSRILIGMSIYTLGEKKGIQDLQNYAFTEKDPRVKKMLLEICSQFNFNSGNSLVSVSE